MNKLPKIIVVAGPTASGKTSLALKIALRLRSGQAQKFGTKGVEIVSADSRQIYRGMDIGTAKPSKKEMTAVPHHLIDIKNPDQNYTVAEYKRDAIKAIRKIIVKRKLPILVGGTGLYIKALIDNLKIPEVKPDFKLRKELEKEIEKYGLKYVFEKLIKLDPEAAYIVDPNNPRRIIRALEIAVKTKKPFSAQRKAGRPLFDFLEIGIKQPKIVLDSRINKRVDIMIKEGLIKEVENLAKKYGQKQQSFDAIGYREIIDYFCKIADQRRQDAEMRGKIRRKSALNQHESALPKEIVDLIKKNTRRYAKRQMTWFKKDKRIHWIQNEKATRLILGREAEKLIKDFLK